MFHQAPGAGPTLEVSVQILSFEPGLYRVSLISQRDSVAPGNGFPWARLEPPPGTTLGQLTIAVQGENDWLARTGDNALVQVALNQAPVLLTIYQVKGVSLPPEFKIERLDVQGVANIRHEAPAALAERPASAINAPMPLAGTQTPVLPQPFPQAAVLIKGMAHLNGHDVAVGMDGWVGVRNTDMPLEGFALTVAGLTGLSVEYSATLGPDWSTPWVRDGAFCGSRGLSLPLRGLTVRLLGPDAERFDLLCLARFVGGVEIGPVPAGQLCAAPDESPIEAFRLVVTRVKHDQAAPAEAGVGDSTPSPRVSRTRRTKSATATKPKGPPRRPSKSSS